MEVIVNNNLFNVKVMMTKKDIECGMMDKKFNKDFDGMLFILEDGNHSFWMKNCIIPLDIIFLEDNKIKKIHKDCKPCKSENCERYKGNGNMVLEIKGGTCDKYDIIEGDTLLFT